MTDRIVIKITGAAGLGIKTSGLMIAKALKRAGYYTFGYTEYPSLIKGGHNIFQIDVSPYQIASSSTRLDILLALDQNSIKLHANEIAGNGALIFDEGVCTVSEEIQKAMTDKHVEIFPLKLLEIVQSVGGTGIMKNTVTLGALWSVLGRDISILNQLISETFGHKSKEVVELNIACIKAGYENLKKQTDHFDLIPSKDAAVKDQMIISGNEAIGIGAISCGVRLYSSYPMTPASSILSFLAVEGTKSGMIVKQAEDEITAANMVVGAEYAGTRAMCGTSGGGFDLMTETLSLAGMTETPFVVVLAQRPGPATGAPTWSAQGDLNLALYGGHGEFPRIVLAPGNATEAFELTIEAHNLAEKYQTPVILLTDKYLSESFFTTPVFDESQVIIDRGELIKENANLRYELTESGISSRWLPGDKLPVFLANSDEHTPKGYSTEDANEIAQMTDKRMRKFDTMVKDLTDPIIFGEPVESSQLLIISWGGNRDVIIDSQNLLAKEGIKTSFMHLSHIWPLNSSFIKDICSKAKSIAVVECNKTGQFANLLEGQTGMKFSDRILKYDGRPFFLEELTHSLKDYIK